MELKLRDEQRELEIKQTEVNLKLKRWLNGYE
jgi:hypothetical protein